VIPEEWTTFVAGDPVAAYSNSTEHEGDAKMDLVKMATSAITPVIAAKIARTLGVPEAIVEKVVAVGVPLVLAAILRRGSAAGGSTAISDLLGALRKDGPGVVPGGQDADVAQTTKLGTDRLGSLLGAGATGTLAAALAKYLGIDAKAAGPLLGLAGGAALGGLKTAAEQQNLDAAGLVRLLGSQKDQLARAIPADLTKALSGSGLLPDVQRLATTTASASTTASQSSAGWLKWLAGLVVLVLLIWLGAKLIGGRETPVATTPAAPAATATAPAATAASSPLVVGGVDVGGKVQGALTDLTSTLAGIKDVDSAKAAVEKLTGVDTGLAGLEGVVTGLPAEGKSALAALINAALPALKSAAEPLMSDAAIGPVVKPLLDSILGRLQAYAG
jgi:hypothetical protein